MLHPDFHDQPKEDTPSFRNTDIAQQYYDGLLSRPEAEVFDVLTTLGVFSLFNAAHTPGGLGPTKQDRESHPSVLLSHIHLSCPCQGIPILGQWISQFLATRQPDAVVIAGNMVKCGAANSVAPNEAILDNLLIIGSPLQDLHGTLAERVAEHLVHEGIIASYKIYSTPIVISFFGTHS